MATIPPLTSNLTFLGTSTSVGVPVIGCDCSVCQSSHPRNKRTRSSLYLKSAGHHILFDTGPDLREQALRENLHQIDHVFFTHDHVDHVTGFDELRAFCWHREDALPLHASAHTLATLERMFPWAFGNTAQNYVRPDPRSFEDCEAIPLGGGLSITPFPVIHAASPTHGFLIVLPSKERIAYIPDVKTVPEQSMPLLSGLDLLIIDALRPEPHHTHMSLQEALQFSARISPRRTGLTHVTHDLDYEITSAALSEDVFLAYDGLSLQFPTL